MDHPLRPRVPCMDTIRTYTAIDPWFASYALEHACLALDLDKLNEIAEGLEALVAYPVAIGNDRVEQLVRERFGIK